MCIIVHVSTTSAEDLSQASECGHLLVPADPATDLQSLAMLAYPQQWYLQSRHGGCSCHFRHAIYQEGCEPAFGVPEDWCPEDWCPEDWCPEAEDNIEDTAAVYDLLCRLVAEGHRVDLVDFWNGEWSGDESMEEVTVTVRLSDVPREAFRLFEEYRFDFVL